MATTTNFGWTTPDNTDAVTNGALAIRTLAGEIDSTVSAVTDKWVSGGIYRNGKGTGNHTQTTNTWVSLVPFVVPNDVTLASVSVNVTDNAGAATSSRLGVYTANATTFLPDTLLVEFGIFNGQNSGIKTISTTQALPAGNYWFAVKLNNVSSYAVAAAGNPINNGAMQKFYRGIVNTVALGFSESTEFAGLRYVQSASGALETSPGTLSGGLTDAPAVVVAVA